MAIARNQEFEAIIHINDSGSGRFMADIIVDGDAFKSENHIPFDFKGIALVGPKYRIIRTAVSNIRPTKPWQRNYVEKILLTFGGADPGNLTIKFLEELSGKIEKIDCTVTAVIGPAFEAKHKDQIQAISKQIPQYHILECPRCLAFPILNHDLVITLGGITAYEAMCLGRPNGAIPWHTMQPYVEQLSQMGLVSNLGTIHQAAHNLVIVLRNLSLLRKTAEIGWNTIDGRGAYRIANTVFL